MEQKKVYIVAAQRTAVAKAKKGMLAKTRSDELLADLMRLTAKSINLNTADIDDVIIGCSFQEAEQGLNIARVASLLAGFPDSVSGFTINRYCSSGVQSVAIGANQIALGQAEVIIAGGVENMSLIPMGGHHWSVSPRVFNDQDIAIAYGMGLTAECVANDYHISRQDQDEFAYHSHMKAVQAINSGYFEDQIQTIQVNHRSVGSNAQIITKISDFKFDEGARADTNPETLAKLKPVFAAHGSVTAGNSSQISDGAGCVILVSEDYLKRHQLTPIGRFLGFAVAGVPAKIMGIGPVKAIPKVLAQVGLSLEQMDWIELNEAFAAQSLAVIRDLKMDSKEQMAKINPDGGAIALGHPLGATGAILTAKMLSGLRRTKKRYGMVTMCIGCGMGAAAVFEAY